MHVGEIVRAAARTVQTMYRALTSVARETTMATFRCELDAPNNIVLVMITEDDGSEHDYQFDFDPRSGRYEFSERDLLERDFGAEWVDEMEGEVRKLIDKAVAARRGAS